jgi:cytosine/adenosine deaminase-related metal-dependent hydrolase
MSWKTLAAATVLLSRVALAAEPGQTAFVDVNVVPMTSDRILPHQTVLVSGSAIAAVRPASRTRIPEGFARIDGRGTYLMPGLSDMHTHVNEPDELLLYTANGVTTVLHMGLAPASFVDHVRGEIEAGGTVGPRIYFGFMIDGSPELGRPYVQTAEQARAAVLFAKGNGYDFIKLYNAVTAAEFEAIVAEAARQHMAVVGHGVRAVGLPEALTRGQVMVAHAEEFYYTAFHNQVPGEADLARVVAETKESGAYVTPNLSTFEIITRQWGKPEVVKTILADPRVQYLVPGTRWDWSRSDYVKRSGDLSPVLSFLSRFTRALADAGVPLLTGTDSPAIPGMLPGYSIHEDLRTLKDAGLSPYQALACATRVPGEFISRFVPGAQPAGTVTEGWRADLVLLEHNPLEDIAAARAPLGVMSGGRYLTRAALAELLEKQKAEYRENR